MGTGQLNVHVHQVGCDQVFGKHHDFEKFEEFKSRFFFISTACACRLFKLFFFLLSAGSPHVQ